jgi:drug/metabolite transporter (DMT)-like permease
VDVFLAVLAAAFFGVSSILVRLSTQHLSPLAVGIVSLVAGCALFIPIGLATQWPVFTALPAITVGWLGVMGVLQFALGRQFNYVAVKMAGVNRATPLFSTAPVFAALLAVGFGNEQVTLLLGAGIAAVVAGSALVANSAGAPQRAAAAVAARRGLATQESATTLLAGAGFAVVAAACYGSIQFMGGHLVREVPAIVASTVTLVSGTVVSAVFGGPFVRWRAPAPQRAYWLAAAAGLTSAFGVLFMLLALTRGEVVRVSPVIAVNSLFSVLLGQIFIRRMESLGWRLLVGIAVVLGGVVLVVVSRAV